jgi:SpoVK/Ycf46/Vps4 family AAA+-type ATPase
VKWNKGAFDKLVLPAPMKDLVKALVTVRTSQRGVKQGLGLAGKREDIISGKGNGLIMLLHGSPGTGKTLTAGIMSSGPWRTSLANLITERYVNVCGLS